MLWNIKQLGFRFVKVRSKGIWISEGQLYMNNKMKTKHWGSGSNTIRNAEVIAVVEFTRLTL